jgi:hypothetical protein
VLALEERALELALYSLAAEPSDKMYPAAGCTRALRES